MEIDRGLWKRWILHEISISLSIFIGNVISVFGICYFIMIKDDMHWQGFAGFFFFSPPGVAISEVRFSGWTKEK